MANQYDTWVGRFTLDANDGITEEAKTTFTCGQCHSLAVAIHELTGWELYGEMGWSDEPRHVFIKTPQGYLDIEGLLSFEQKPDAFALTLNEVKNFRTYKKCDPSNAQPFAKLVLQEYLGVTH